ncbi:hypothetical protein ABZY58_11405 [Micromonospora tulbaghiae]|uniref:hypothetical protein n=1 Tax=Micromonospora tulbaghiae TaxID=479978 RepID=UPI0033B6C4CA
MSTDIVSAAQTTNGSGDGIATRAASVIDGDRVIRTRNWQQTTYNLLAVPAATIAVAAVAAIAAGAQQVGVTLACVAGALMFVALIVRAGADVRRWIYTDPS